MNDSHEDDDDLPGAIKARVIARVEALSSGSSEEEDEERMAAFLMKGRAKREAMQQLERKRNERQQASQKSVSSLKQPTPPSERRRERRRHAAAAAGASSEVVDVDADNDGADIGGAAEAEKLAAADAALLRERAERSAKVRKINDTRFDWDDDDEEEEEAVAEGGADRAPFAGARAQRSLWLKVRVDGVEEMLHVSTKRDVPLADGLVGVVATRAGLRAPRVQLSARCGALDLRRTARELGLADDECVDASEAAAAQLTFKLTQSAGAPLTLQIDADAPLSTLVGLYCEHERGGHGEVQPARLRLLDPDDEPLDVTKTAAHYELEDGDQLAVQECR